MSNNEDELITETEEKTESENSNNKEESTSVMNGTANTESEHKTKDEEHIEKEKEEWVDLLGSGAVLKKIIIEGDPDTRPQRLEKCKINYCCLLEDGTVVDSADNFELHVGDCDVISGLDVSLGLMNVGEKCRLKIQPRLAFGEKGLIPQIPPDSTVIYDVELISVQPEDEIESLSIEERRLIGNKKRERGNWWYSRGDYNIAIQCYRRSMDYLDIVEEISKDVVPDEQALIEDKVSIYNNMAAAQLKLELFDAAEISLRNVMRYRPENVKAHFRLGMVHKGKHNYAKALSCLKDAENLSPNDPEIRKEIWLVQNLLRDQTIKERAIFRKMFQLTKYNPAAANGPAPRVDRRRKKSNKFGLWATLGATVAIGVASIMAYRFKYT